MIGPVVAAVRDHVVTPQTTTDVTAERRLILDPDQAPIDAAPQTVEVVARGWTLIGREIGGGRTYRHDVDVIVTVIHGDMAEAFRIREAIADDLADRYVDWPNVNLAGQEFQDASPSSALFGEGTTDDPNTLAAYAVLTFTVETTVRP